MDTQSEELKHLVFIWLKSQTCLVFLFCQIEKFKKEDFKHFSLFLLLPYSMSKQTSLQCG